MARDSFELREYPKGDSEYFFKILVKILFMQL